MNHNKKKNKIFLKIGSIALEYPIILAPMAGITDLPFRLIVKELGCPMVCSEMISANGLVNKSKKTIKMISSLRKEKPLSLQIFGSDPFIMAEAAAIAEQSGVDIIDINFGCSVKKIVKTGSGVALMKDYKKSEEIIKSVREAITVPLTIKLRSGWDREGTQVLKIAKIAETRGVDAICIHPRTATQGFGGKADWSLIKAVKKSVSIPVIGNGDITIPQKALKMMEQTNCDGVMIGRSAIDNPWIFSQTISLLNKEAIISVDLNTRLEMILRYINLLVEHYGENHACRMMRSRIGWFVKGLPNSSKFRQSITRLSSKDEAVDIVTSYFMGSN